MKITLRLFAVLLVFTLVVGGTLPADASPGAPWVAQDGEPQAEPQFAFRLFLPTVGSADTNVEQNAADDPGDEEEPLTPLVVAYGIETLSEANEPATEFAAGDKIILRGWTYNYTNEKAYTYLSWIVESPCVDVEGVGEGPYNADPALEAQDLEWVVPACAGVHTVSFWVQHGDAEVTYAETTFTVMTGDLGAGRLSVNNAFLQYNWGGKKQPAPNGRVPRGTKPLWITVQFTNQTGQAIQPRIEYSWKLKESRRDCIVKQTGWQLAYLVEQTSSSFASQAKPHQYSTEGKGTLKAPSQAGVWCLKVNLSGAEYQTQFTVY